MTVKMKDPTEVFPIHFIWCDEDGSNANSATNTGQLEGATISSYTVTVDSGLTKDSDAKSARTIKGIAYGINTIVTATLSGGTAGTTYGVVCKIVTSDSRTLEQKAFIRVQDSV